MSASNLLLHLRAQVDTITEQRDDARRALNGLLAVLNEDKDGGWFLCAEAKDAVSEAERVAGLQTEVQHYDRIYTVIGTFPDTEQGRREANAYMVANPVASLLCIIEGTAYLAHKDDIGRPS